MGCEWGGITGWPGLRAAQPNGWFAPFPMLSTTGGPILLGEKCVGGSHGNGLGSGERCAGVFCAAGLESGEHCVTGSGKLGGEELWSGGWEPC